MKSLLIVLSLGLAMTLGACTTGPRVLSQDFENANPRKGYVSLEYTGNLENELYVARVGADGRVMAGTGATLGNPERMFAARVLKRRGPYFFVHELEPGVYRYLGVTSRDGQRTFTTDIKLDYAFEVRAGDMLYLGAFESQGPGRLAYVDNDLATARGYLASFKKFDLPLRPAEAVTGMSEENLSWSW